MKIGNQWDELLKEEWYKKYYLDLREKLIEEYRHFTIFPDKYLLFESLKQVDYKDVKVVILGQDPYHGKGQAHGFSFSVLPGTRIPPSLRNIYKELQDDLGCSIPNNGYLLKWAKQGVLLLNTSLTVREGQANSHKDLGWQILTDRIIEILGNREKEMVFILWGSHAQKKGAFIDRSRHLVLSAPHPSPLSAHRGFFGSRPFSQANAYLKAQGKSEIDWQV